MMIVIISYNLFYFISLKYLLYFTDSTKIAWNWSKMQVYKLSKFHTRVQNLKNISRESQYNFYFYFFDYDGDKSNQVKFSCSTIDITALTPSLDTPLSRYDITAIIMMYSTFVWILTGSDDTQVKLIETIVAKVIILLWLKLSVGWLGGS